MTIVYRRLWEQGSRESLRKPSQLVVLANGEPLHVQGGTTEVVISIADICVKQEALVTDKVSQDCLLGADFLILDGFYH